MLGQFQPTHYSSVMLIGCWGWTLPPIVGQAPVDTSRIQMGSLTSGGNNEELCYKFHHRKLKVIDKLVLLVCLIDNKLSLLSHPGLGDFMFSVRFRRVRVRRVRVRRRKNFSLSRQNHLS